MKEAPLFIQCQALARWLLQNFEAQPALMDSVQRGSLRLLDDVVLALKDFDRDERLRSADATAALLRSTSDSRATWEPGGPAARLPHRRAGRHRPSARRMAAPARGDW